MSYRAFKRLLGETSLERKCHFLFGGFILVLITGSFWLYARQTESLAYEQITTACRLIAVQIMDQQITTKCRPPSAAGVDAAERARMVQALAEFRAGWEKRWPEALQAHKFTLIKASAPRPDQAPDDESFQKMTEFRTDSSKQEENQILANQGRYLYYGAVRASPSCVSCHRKLQPDLAENDLLAVIKIEVPTEPIEAEFHSNRELQFSTVLLMALLITSCNFVIVRYVIAKKP
jgi:two-component system, NarL family, sensor histidine kinase BarA